ncbi:tRNA (adenosine(37)-N6)-threonylcarbamoyltransferase complex dimerization subunit type 1 TsaB [Alteromonas sp. C1M14]|uniref:tRNA (adenosine(37)-N6)-threonylcarbamoyltransferase complex dimerization subunit type 1 TsaB n=1 Tax=Alteromonas sp. C1M14 TaxID=2841567 RepID=UPI001C09DF5C|nr:tRNA (adenosine(37)-N6)-threonylcarbamoyltransferase complex dimerization subunit type 1 TsaB [Alteromonas sp. C1M14]MBU2979772.1 tRNA (adenosine(37)-N6)-threonylcarbamoyltransferase complex dimerization subunit type 1 TsaB [Alteromonas sp. C1M14]
MKLLAIDTATEACSVALLVPAGTFSQFEICPQQHSQRLLPMVDDVLTQAQQKISDIEGLIYGRGPGSFTGVRIATGMVQGLALGTHLQVAGVSTMAAMAQQAIDEKQADYVICAIDARMGEVYFAHYKNEKGLAVCVGEEKVCAPDVAAENLPDSFEPVGTGWAAYPALSSRLTTTVSVLYPNAEAMLKLGQAQFTRGEVTSVDDIQPVYLRDKVTWKKLPGRE